MIRRESDHRLLGWTYIRNVTVISLGMFGIILGYRFFEVSRFFPSAGSMDDIRKVRALETLSKVLDLGPSLDTTVKSLEKFEAASATLDGATANFIRRLSAKADRSGIFRIPVARAGRSVLISLPADLLFEGKSNQLSLGAQSAIQEVAEIIEPFGDEFDLEVIGHTSIADISRGQASPRSGGGDGWMISASRAASVVGELVKHGVRPGRIRASGVADTRGLFPARRPDGSIDRQSASLNRRIELSLTIHDAKVGVTR